MTKSNSETSNKIFFAQNSYCELKYVLPENILKNIQKLCQSDVFSERIINNSIGVEEYIASSFVIKKLELLISNTSLIKNLESIIEKKIDYYTPRITRLHAGKHHIDWHDDSSIKGRVAALSINLFSNSYEEGFFELRKKDDQSIIISRSETLENQGILFGIKNDCLEHRVKSPSTGVRTHLIVWLYNGDL